MLIGLALWLVPSAHANTGGITYPCDGATPSQHGDTARSIIKKAYAQKRWHHAHPLGDKTRGTLNTAVSCSQHPAQLRRSWRKQKAQFFEYRAIRKIATIDCGSYWSVIPCYITDCESGGNLRARNPISSAGGRYQILNTSWYAYGGTHYAGYYPAASAPELEQHEVAARIWADRHGDAWSCA